MVSVPLSVIYSAKGKTYIACRQIFNCVRGALDCCFHLYDYDTCVAQTELESVRKVCEWEKKRRLGQLTSGCPPDIAAILNLHPVISDTAKPAGQLVTFTDNLCYSTVIKASNLMTSVK